MSTLILHHDDCLRHDPGPTHPERPARIGAALAGLQGIDGLERLPAPLATPEQVYGAHPPEYLEWLTVSEPDEGLAALDADTAMSPGSLAATLRASGAVCFAIDEVMAGKARNAFCATRPPGHHAEASRAMGFCLLNQVAVGARYALARHGVGRVAILDFDVHHGNGTQAIFEDDLRVLYISSHQVPLYPGTGMPNETGLGNIVNLPLPPGDDGEEFRRAWSTRGLPTLERFAPDLVLFSAGFDGHARDPLAQLELGEADFGWLTHAVREWARGGCEDRIVSTLEGGYDLEAITASVHAHVAELARP